MGFSDAYNKAKSISNAEAYELDLSKEGRIRPVGGAASRLLTNANFLAISITYSVNFR
jgi:hypothetical protein